MAISLTKTVSKHRSDTLASGRVGRPPAVDVEALTTTGEAMSRAEIGDCLAQLYGAPDLDQLPAELTATDFAEGVLGFEAYA